MQIFKIIKSNYFKTQTIQLGAKSSARSNMVSLKRSIKKKKSLVKIAKKILNK